MWLACALIILFSVGFVLPCMLDITMTPDSEFTTFSKGTWLVIAGAFWVFGATAWLLVGRPRRLGIHRSNPYPPGGLGPYEALLRHPAARAAGGNGDLFGSVGLADSRPLGPDDDPDFLVELGRRIRESRDGSLYADERRNCSSVISRAARSLLLRECHASALASTPR